MTEPNNNAQKHGVAIFTNLAATVLLAALLALGVYVNVNKLLISSIPTDGYRVVNLDTTSWNVACTVVGTAVGILAAVAFANQDDCLTRHELASDRGVVAMFLRPLTVKRGAEQIFRLQLPFERTLLVILTVATALMGATVVALFSIRATTEEIVNPIASFPLMALNSSFFVFGRDGSVTPAGSPAYTSVRSQLSGFLYKAAYITGLKLNNEYIEYGIDYPYLPEQGPLGDTIYGKLNTGGVGLNMSSYTQYSGYSDGFNMPAKFEFNELRGSIFGTLVSVSCQNATSQYTLGVVTEPDINYAELMAVGKSGGPNITLFNDFKSYGNKLVIGSAVTIDSASGEPTHTLIIPDFSRESAFVLECNYSGREYLFDVFIASSVSPLRINGERLLGPILGPYVKQQLANLTHDMLARGSMGGNVAQGFIDADYNNDGDNNTDMATALETVIGQLGEAYFSVLRQQVERSNLYKGES